jgi:subtilisin family serine protease
MRGQAIVDSDVVRRRTAFLIGLALASFSGLGRAQVDARALGAARIGSTRPITVVFDLPADVPGLRVVAPGLGAAEVLPAELAGMGVLGTWSAPLRVLMDRATESTGAAVFRETTGETGQGVVIGIVDTGVDASHPDLQDAFGHTRIAWYLDLASEPLGLHPDLEADYGCSGASFHCAVLSAVDLDGSVAVPADPEGHGTHVASLAAGIAPGATLVVVRATRDATGTVLDADALLATRFVFDRATELGLPAVANLSIGTDFGAHDGSSRLEQGLEGFVRSGRVIVVAAGNSGELYRGLTDRYPEPLGIHTEVHVPDGSSVRVPVITPRIDAPVTHATLYLWVAGRPGDELEVGLDDPDGRWIGPVSPGHAVTRQKGDLEATILNGVGEQGGSVVGASSAAVILDGAWTSGATFAVRFEGHGTARLWVQSEGELSPSTGSIGAVFPRALRQGTVNLPATHPALIAVGATVNRTDWIDREGDTVEADLYGPIAAVAPFSAAGPNAAGDLKPEIVAPGALVVGAMSAGADPEHNGGRGLFRNDGICGALTDCLVVDDQHAVASGTSMAAPIVAGAAALVLGRDPSLTADQVRALLQAGARRTETGAGALDLGRTLEALQPAASRDPAASASFLVLADDYAHPDPDWPLRGLVTLRTAQGHVAGGVDPGRIRLETSPARIVEPLVETAPGLLAFAVAARSGTGGGRLRLRVLLDGEPLLERTIPIAVDHSLAEGSATARGGCSASRGAASPAALWVALCAIGLLRRRYMRAR